MEMRLQINRIIFFILVSVLLLFFLYNVNILYNPYLETICIYKNIFGRDCWNCGMTRAFQAILHGEFDIAIKYNWKCIFVFPFTVIVYLYSWYKFIFKNNM